MKNKRYIAIRILTVVLTAAVILAAAELFFQSASAQNPAVSSKADNSLPVPAPAPEIVQQKSYVVSRADVVKDLILTGELRAAQSTSITAPDIQSSFSNMVTYLAPEGSQIKKGQLIVEFDDSTLLSNKSEAERTLDEAKLKIEKTKADLEAQRCDLLSSLSDARSQLEQDELYGKISKSLLPGNTYQKYQLNLQQSKLAVQKAQEQLDNFEKSYSSQMAIVEINKSQAEINLKKIISDMDLLKINAPQDGIMIYGDNWASNRKIQPGDTLFHGMEVARLPDLSTMQVVGYVYDTEYSLLSPNERCTITLDSLPDYKTGGRILSLTNVAARKGFATQKKVFQATVQLDKVDTEVLKPGMTARVVVPIVLAKDTPAIPRTYLGIDSHGRYYVFKGNDPKTASIQFVQPGAIGDRMIQIASGLSSGDPLLPLQSREEVTE